MYTVELLFIKKYFFKKIVFLSSHVFWSKGTESKVSVGVLNIRLEMYPKLNKTLSQEIVTTQVSLNLYKHSFKHYYFNAIQIDVMLF